MPLLRRTVLALPLLALAAAATTARAQGVARLAVAPAELTIVVGERQRLTATARDAAGGALAGAPVRWRTSNARVATVDAAGVVTAVATGRAGITAESGGRSALALVTVAPPGAPGEPLAAPGAPAERKSRDVAPAEPELRATPAEPERRRGNVTGPAWIDEEKRDLAAAIRRQAPPRRFEPVDSAALAAAVRASADPARWPNQPAGFAKLSERAFSSKATPGGDAALAEGWEEVERRYPNFSIVDDPSAPRSPPRVGQFLYPRGFVAGRSPATAQYRFDRPVRELYISLWVKLSPNWHGNQTGTNKIFFVWIDGRQRVFLSAEGVGANRLQPQLRLQGVDDRRPRLRPNRHLAASVERGAWQRWELVLRANTPGRADGELHWWIDGRKVSEYRDVNIVRAGRPDTWDLFQWNATYGGGGAPVPHDQWVRWDHIYISGR